MPADVSPIRPKFLIRRSTLDPLATMVGCAYTLDNAENNTTAAVKRGAFLIQVR
jgi:hypothetical protein